MIKVLFVCYGNICRSPMAEFIFRKMLSEREITDVSAASAATSWEEYGNPVYPNARKKLAEHGIDSSGKRAVPAEKRDYGKYDLIIAMERSNVSALKRIFGGDPEGKIHLLLEYAGETADISDPWYTRDFDRAYDDIERGCRGLVRYIESRQDGNSGKS